MVLAYLSIFVNSKDEISLLKTINFPKRGIGEVACFNLQQEAGEMLLLDYLLSEKFKYSKYYSKLENYVNTIKSLKAEMNTCTLFDFVKKVVTQFGIEQAYAGKDEEAINRLENIDSLLTGVQEYQDENEEATLSEYLSNILLKADSDTIQEIGYVSLATIHAVKGLEFKVVFVVGLEEGIFPLSRASLSDSELEEERRLMYVAVTRAEEKIYLIHASKRYMYGKSNYQKESRFLAELGNVDKKKPRVTLFETKPKSKSEENFESGFSKGDIVSHPRFGTGKIVNISDDGLVADINFLEFGMKSLMLNLASLEKIENED